MNKISEYLRLTREETVVFLIGVLGSFIARGITFFSLGYAIDDYANTLLAPTMNMVLFQGRWGAGLLFEIFNYIGIQCSLSTTLLMSISVIGFTLIGIMICRMWKINSNIILSSLVVLFITLFPYQAEIYTFKITLTFFIFALFIGFVAVYFSRLKFKTSLLTALIFAFAVSMYQLVINYVFVAIVLSLAIELLRSLKREFNEKFWTDLLKRTNFLPQLLTISLGTLLYLIVNKIILLIFQIAMTSRGQFINIHEIPSRFSQIRKTLFVLLAKNEPIMPIIPKMLLLLILVFVLFGIIKISILNAKKIRNSYAASATLLLLLAISLLGVIGVSIPLESWWPVPRVFASLGIFWAGVLVLLFVLFDGKIKKIFIGISAILVLSFIGINNHIYVDQLRINMIDIQKANRIILRLEMLPDFSRIKSVAIIGKKWGYGDHVKTIEGDMNISAFGADWAKLSIINEVGGYDFLAASDDEVKSAENFCVNALKTQDSDIVTGILGSLGVVCI